MKKKSFRRWLALLAAVTCITAGMPVLAAEPNPADAAETVDNTRDLVENTSETADDSVDEALESGEDSETGETENPADPSDSTDSEDPTDPAEPENPADPENPDDPDKEEEPYANVIYQGHVQSIGWQDEVSNGADAGTIGQSRRMEGIKIKVDSNIEGGISYRTHVQSIGWQNWVSDGEMAGTSGRALRLEAIQIRLDGELANEYDVYYRAHIEKIGWLAWAKNGESAGSEEYAFRMEALEIRLVKKGETDPAITTGGTSFVKLGISYESHIQNIGWQGLVYNGAVSGTGGRKLRMEGLKINLSSYWGNQISYRAHVQKVGWQNWVSGGAIAGTTGQSLRMEAIQIKLTGTMEGLYDVYYRVHTQKFGWLGWAKNGESAGTEAYGYRMEAIQIKIVRKGQAAPGSTGNAFKKYVAPPKPTVSQINASAYNTSRSNPQAYASSTQYLILVNNSSCTTTIYTGSKGNWKVLKSMSCCVGKASTPTVRGVYYVNLKGTYFDTGISARCWYYTQFNGDYLFHSVIYDRQNSPNRVIDGTMGRAVSHGCVRLTLNNAKWIYDNIPSNTTVVSF